MSYIKKLYFQLGTTTYKTFVHQDHSEQPGMYLNEKFKFHTQPTEDEPDQDPLKI